jgi:hypothetical protein
MNYQRLRALLIRDKQWLGELYLANNILQTKRLLNFGADTKLETLIKYLHCLSNGSIKMKKSTFEKVKNSHITFVKRHFETKAALNRLLQSDREEKLKILRKLCASFSYLLYPLFNEQNGS